MKKVVLLSLAAIFSLNVLATFILDNERDAYFVFLDQNENMLEGNIFTLMEGKIVVFSPAKFETTEKVVKGKRIVEYVFLRDSLDTFSYRMSEKKLFSLEQNDLLQAYETGSYLLTEENTTIFSDWGLFKRNLSSQESLEYDKENKMISLVKSYLSSNRSFNWSVFSYFLLVLLFVLFIFSQAYRQAPNKRRRNKKFKFPVVFSHFFVIFALLLLDYFISMLNHSTEMSLFQLILNDDIWINFFGLKDESLKLQLVKLVYLAVMFFVPLFSVFTIVLYYKGDIIFTTPLLLSVGFIFSLFFPLILLEKIALFIALLIFSIFLLLFMKRINHAKLKELYQQKK